MSAVAKFICWTNTPPPPPAANTNTQIHKSTFSLQLLPDYSCQLLPHSIHHCCCHFEISGPSFSIFFPQINLCICGFREDLLGNSQVCGSSMGRFLDCALKDETILVARRTLRVNGLRRVHCTLGSLHQMNRFTWSELDQYVRSWKEALYYLHKKQIVGEVRKCVFDFLGFFLSFVSSIPFFALSRVFSAR